MISHMNERPTEGGRQLLTAHPARRVIIPGSQHTNPSRRISKGGSNFSQQLRQRLIASLLSLQQRKLLFRKLLSFRIAEHTVHAAGNMPQMKSHRRQPKRPRMYLHIGETSSPLTNIVRSEIKRMQNSATHRRHFRIGPAHPRFNG